MSNIKEYLKDRMDLIGSGVLGAISVAAGYVALDTLLTNVSDKTYFLQTEFMIKQGYVMTERAHVAAREAAAAALMGGESWQSGFYAAAFAGFTGIMAVYLACRSRK